MAKGRADRAQRRKEAASERRAFEYRLRHPRWYDRLAAIGDWRYTHFWTYAALMGSIAVVAYLASLLW